MRDSRPKKRPSGPESSTQRLFFALWPSGTQQANLAAALPESVRSAGRLIPPGNYHVTLKFLGSVSADRMPAVTASGARIASAFDHGLNSLRMDLDRVEFWRDAAIACATASTPAEGAGILFESLRNALEPDGFDPDGRPFRAHVTLARKVAHLAPQSLSRPVTWQLSELALMQSRTLPSGSLYSTVQAWPLCGEARKRLEKKHQ